MKRLLGLDYGSKTVGVAVTDPLRFSAQGIETICRKKENQLRKTFARIEEIVKEYDPEKIILGLPLNMNDSEGDRAEKTREFAAALERRTGLEVVLQDERLTTVEADGIMEEMGIERSLRKDRIDSIAAAIILQDYINDGRQKDHTEIR